MLVATLGELALLLAAIAGAKYFHGIGASVTAAARDARMNDPVYAQKAADYNAAQVAANTGSNIAVPKVEAPIPTESAVHTASVAAQTNVLDTNAWIRDYFNLTTGNQTPASRKLADQAGLVLNDGSWQTRIRSFMNTGVDYVTGMKIPSPKRVFDDIEVLSNDDKTTLTKGLMSANELDNRRLAAQRGTPARYDYYNQSDQDLARDVVTMQRDPVLNDIATRYQAISKGMIDIGGARNFFSPAEVTEILRTHPNHVPDVDNTGRVLHAMGPRNMTPNGGVSQVNTNPWAAMAQHVETLYRQFELNEFRTGAIDHQLNVQQQFPNSAQFVTRQQATPPTAPSLYPTMGGQGTGPRENVLAVRRQSGVEYYKIDHPHFYDIVSGNNLNKAKTMFDTASIPRRWLQTGTTGIGSLAQGRIFPLVNAMRTMFQAPINRPQGMVGGLMDLGMQKVTGGRLSYRWLDPTNLVGASYSQARTAFDDLFMLQLSHAFDKSNANPVTQLLKTIITPANMDIIRDGLMDKYTKTTTFEQRSGGVGGQGVPFRTRLPAFSRTGGESPQTIRLMAGEIAPKLFLSGGKLGTIKPHVINLKNAVEETFSGISDAGHDYFYRLNKFKGGMGKESLAYETRALTGDPGVSGAGKAVNAVTSAIPYANVSAQGLARRGRAFNETPFGTGAALMGSLGSAALLSIYTAMQNKDTLDYLQNVISTQGRAANVLIFGNANPALHTAFSLPQEERAPYAIMLDVVAKALNLLAVPHDDAHHDGVLGFLKDWFSEHIENSTWEAAMHGLADAGNIVDVPNFVNAIMAPSGKTARLDLDRVASDYSTGGGMLGNLGFDTFYMPTGTDGPLPNHPPGDNALEGADSQKFSLLFSNLFGMMGGVFDDVTGFNRYYHQTGDFFASLGQAGQDWLQKAMDANPGLNNIVWENPVRESMRTPMVEKVSRELLAMKATAGATTAERNEGTTGGPRPLPVTPQTGPGKVPNDPETGYVMRNMYMATAQEHAWIEKTVVADINALKKQMADRALQMGNTREKREWENEQKRAINDKYYYIQSRIDDLNASFSRAVGAPVDVMHIDWAKGPEQFHN